MTSDGADFLVIDIPKPGDRLHLTSVWSRLPADENQGVPVLHAADALESMLSADKQIYYEKGHYHLTPLASRNLTTFIAERIAPALLQGRCGGRR